MHRPHATGWKSYLHRHVLYVLFSGLHVQSTVCLSGFALEAGHEGISCNCQNSNIDSCAPRAAAVSMQVVIPTSQIRSGASTTHGLVRTWEERGLVAASRIASTACSLAHRQALQRSPSHRIDECQLAGNLSEIWSTVYLLYIFKSRLLGREGMALSTLLSLKPRDDGV